MLTIGDARGCLHAVTLGARSTHLAGEVDQTAVLDPAGHARVNAAACDHGGIGGQDALLVRGLRRRRGSGRGLRLRLRGRRGEARGVHFDPWVY